MTDELQIRIGVPDDIDEMMTLSSFACDENGFTNPNPVKILHEIWAALNRDHGMVAIIGKPNGPAEGAILLRITTPWYSDDQILEERGIFIHPEHRSAKGGRARKLAEFSKQVSDSLKLPMLIGVLSNHRTEGKVRLYGRIFGDQAGAFFLYNARTGKQMTMEH